VFAKVALIAGRQVKLLPAEHDGADLNIGKPVINGYRIGKATGITGGIDKIGGDRPLLMQTEFA